MGNILPKPPSIPQAAGKEWPGWADPEALGERVAIVEGKTIILEGATIDHETRITALEAASLEEVQMLIMMGGLF